LRDYRQCSSTLIRGGRGVVEVLIDVAVGGEVPHARRELGGQFFGMLEDASRLAQRSRCAAVLSRW
jgi:hypothetical protein